MTKQNADRFIKISNEDPRIRKIAFELYQKGRKESLEQLAAQKGCVCTYEEIVSSFISKKANQHELSDKELQTIAAGMTKPSGHGGLST